MARLSQCGRQSSTTCTYVIHENPDPIHLPCLTIQHSHHVSLESNSLSSSSLACGGSTTAAVATNAISVAVTCYARRSSGQGYDGYVCSFDCCSASAAFTSEATAITVAIGAHALVSALRNHLLTTVIARCGLRYSPQLRIWAGSESLCPSNIFALFCRKGPHPICQRIATLPRDSFKPPSIPTTPYRHEPRHCLRCPP